MNNKNKISILKLHSAFTLVELLVVVAILAVLMSLFMPALNTAMHKARLVHCQKNLKDIHLGVHMYSDDNNSLYPKNKNVRTKTFYFGYSSYPNGPTNQEKKERDGAIMDLLEPYHSTLNTYMCPGAKEITEWEPKYYNYDVKKSEWSRVISSGYNLFFNAHGKGNSDWKLPQNLMTKEEDTFTFKATTGQDQVSFDIIASDLAYFGTTHVMNKYIQQVKRLDTDIAYLYQASLWENNFLFQDGSVLVDTYLNIGLGYMTPYSTKFYKEIYASPTNDITGRLCIPRLYQK